MIYTAIYIQLMHSVNKVTSNTATSLPSWAMSYAHNYAPPIKPNGWRHNQLIDSTILLGTMNNDISMETLFSKLWGAGAFLTSKSVTIKSLPTNV